MNESSLRLVGGETLTAWQVLRHVQARHIEVGGNRIANWFARQRAEMLRSEIGQSLGAWLSGGEKQIDAEFVIGDPKDQELIRGAVAKIIADPEQLSDGVGRSIINNRYRIQRSFEVEALHVALGGLSVHADAEASHLDNVTKPEFQVE